MTDYLLALYDDPSEFADLSPDEIQAVIGEYLAWSEKLRAADRLIEGNKLADGEGRVLRGGETPTAVDGPYAEAREVLGGYTLVRAESYDDVTALCADHPHLKYGGTIEIRRIESFD